MDHEEEEPDMLKEGIEVVFGKKQYRDLLMQNWGILTAESKHIPTACKY